MPARPTAKRRETGSWPTTSTGTERAPRNSDGFAGFAYSHLFDRDDKHKPKPKAEEMLEALMPGKADVPWRAKR